MKGVDGRVFRRPLGRGCLGEIPDSAAALTLRDYVSPKNTSSLTQTVNASVENGTVFYSQVLSLVVNKPVAADITEIQNLAKGRLAIVVQDLNDNYFVMGHIRGAELTGGSIATGTAIGDLNGFTLEFTAEEAIPAPFLDETGANLTFHRHNVINTGPKPWDRL